MKAVAIKKGQTGQSAAAFKEMGTLRCDSCGEEFIVFHDSGFVDKAVAERQAHWLEKVLAEEHERERKHPDPYCCRNPRRWIGSVICSQDTGQSGPTRLLCRWETSDPTIHRFA